MDQFLRKYQWVLHFVVLGIGATLTATIVNHSVVSAQLAPLTVPKLPSHRIQNGGSKAETDEGPRPGQWDERLASQCLFGCTSESEREKKSCPGGCGENEKCKEGVCVPTKDQKSKPEKPDVPVESDLNVKLLGCMVAGESKYSFAMVQDGKSQETYVVSPGDYLPEDSEVVRIARDRIFIRRNGQLEFIRLESTIGGDPSPVSTTATGSAAAGSPTPVRNLEQATGSAASGDEVVLQKDQVQEKLKDRRELAREVQTTANYENGQKKGVKLVGVSPNSLYSKLGFETGDVLHSVGGNKVNSGTDISALIDQLKNREEISVVVERNGKKVERTFKMK